MELEDEVARHLMKLKYRTAEQNLYLAFFKERTGRDLPGLQIVLL